MEHTTTKYAIVPALIAVFALAGCDSTKKAGDTGAGNAAAPAAATQSAEVELDTSAKRLSYGIGYNLGRRMLNDRVPLDKDAFTAGVTDLMADKEPRMTEEEISQEMEAYQEQAQKEMAAEQAKLGAANLAASEVFLKENGAREGVTTTDSGLQYEVIEAGDGPKPGPQDTVEVHYRGTLADGTEFDSSYSRGETVQFGVGQVIPGWTEALQLMPVGSKWKLAIPPELGYGAGGAGRTIGPNAALVFDVELVSIPSQKAAPEEGDAVKSAAEG